MDVMKAMLDSASHEREKNEEDTFNNFDEDDFSIGESSEEEDEDEGEVRGYGEAAGGEGEGRSSGGRGGEEEGMEEVMAAMDREIGVSEVGKSFEKMKVGCVVT